MAPAKLTVDVANAQARYEDDKAKVDEFIRNGVGFDVVNQAIAAKMYEAQKQAKWYTCFNYCWPWGDCCCCLIGWDIGKNPATHPRDELTCFGRCFS